MASGSLVRDTINQGFARAEMGSLADKKATQVYGGAHADGKVVSQRCTDAILNYKAAVACFVRVLPSLDDDRSANLVRDEIRRLLARLYELQKILKQTDPENELLENMPDDSSLRNDEDALRNRLLADLRFQVGDEVDVDEVRPGTIVSVDLENGTYGIEYLDGTLDSGVVESRVRARSKAPEVPIPGFLNFRDDNDIERYKIWSELVESERVYRDALAHLVKDYIIPLDNPTFWGGQKDKKETVFTQKTLTLEERGRIFGNVEDIAGTSAMVLTSLEARFAQWEAEQKLADVFLEFASLFQEGYPIYADAYFTSIQFLLKIRSERSGFDAVFERARLLGAPPLEDLMRLPLQRPAQCRKLLQDLAHRTPESHPDYKSIRDAFLLFGRVEEQISLALNRVKLEEKLKEIEQQFSPAIALYKKGRYLLKSQENLRRIEGSVTTPRCVWLFNDILILGRKSEWFNRGLFRHLLQFAVTKARASPEYGPLAFEIAGQSESCIFVAFDENEKHEWLKALRGFIVKQQTPSLERRRSKKLGAVVPPPPPAQPAGTPTVVLGEQTLKVLQQKAKSAERAATPPAPSAVATTYRGQALFDFTPQEIDDLAFNRGDLLELDNNEFIPGWTKGKKIGGDGSVGSVPLNYIRRL